jgi:phage protein D/phage baseplate assembly protein gpV
MKAAVAVGRLEVELAGTPLSDDEAGRLSAITLRQRLSLPAQLELLFQGVNSELATKAGVMVGLSAAVRGDPDRATLFQGDITAVEVGYGPDGALDLRIRAYDPLHRLRKRQSIRGFSGLDVGDLARQLAGEIGLSVNARDSGHPRAQIIQWRQTDLGILTEAAAAAGLYFVATPDSLELFSLSGSNGSPIELRLGDELFEAGFEINGDDAVDSVAAVGWDPTTGRRFEESATSARSGRTAGARPPLSDLGGDPKRTVANVVARDSDEVQAAAQGKLDRAIASQLVLRGVAAGHAGIRPGASVQVERVVPSFGGEYQVTEAIHTIDAERGYLTSFSTAPPPMPDAQSWTMVAPGIVERVDDPEKQGRVAVSLPTLPTVQTEWMRVLLPGVGERAGLVTLPNTGDEVLVLFPAGDLAGGVVLGGLFAGGDAPDFGVVSDQVQRYSWRTREGQRVELDQARNRLRMIIPNGSAITLGHDRLTIHAATDLEIAAPGRTIVIKAKAVDFQQAESS